MIKKKENVLAGEIRRDEAKIEREEEEEGEPREKRFGSIFFKAICYLFSTFFIQGYLRKIN